MKDGERLSLEQMRAFLEAREEVGFKVSDAVLFSSSAPTRRTFEERPQ